MDARNARTDRIGELLRAYGLLGMRMGEAVAGRLDMEHIDMRALNLIAQAARDGHPSTVSDLRERLGLSAGGTTLVVDRLERAGHVRRVRDTHDRRSVRLLVTTSGTEAGRRHFGGLTARLAALSEQFTDDEMAAIERFLNGVINMTGAHLAEILAPTAQQPDSTGP